VWGEFRRARAGSEAPPPARSEQKPAKKFFFLLEEKVGAHKIKKCEENFFACWRAKRAAEERSVSFKIGSDFVKQTHQN
jgi:hypothetical protein